VAARENPLRGILDPVARKLQLPFGTRDFIDKIVRGGVDQAGRRTLQMLITTWDVTGGGPFAASAIATAGLAKTVDIAQGLFIGPVFNPLLKALGADQVAFRASLCASAVVGLGIMRYGVRVEPIHTMDVDSLVNAMAPTLQRYLIGDIS
jgi:Tetracyclin repressor-like, C-terminal domain